MKTAYSKDSTFQKFLDTIFIEFMNDGEESFINAVLNRSRIKMEKDPNTDLEVLNLSNAILEKARLLENANHNCDKWRKLSAALRRAAHVLFREGGQKSNCKWFLKRIK